MSWMSPRTVQTSTLPAVAARRPAPAPPAADAGSSGSRISIASRKISPAMMRPLMKYSPDW